MERNIWDSKYYQNIILTNFDSGNLAGHTVCLKRAGHLIFRQKGEGWKRERERERERVS
jgi:hypothetical protein